MKAVRPLHSEQDYQTALIEFERYFDNEPEPGSSDGDRFELLGILIGHYEEEHFPITSGDQLDVLQAYMDAKGLTQADLSRTLNSRSRASEILSRKKRLSLAQIEALREQWGIPADLLLGGVSEGIRPLITLNVWGGGSIFVRPEAVVAIEPNLKTRRASVTLSSGRSYDLVDDMVSVRRQVEQAAA
jgi:HTH-type transcriptional regulator/antitoxin HigA